VNFPYSIKSVAADPDSTGPTVQVELKMRSEINAGTASQPRLGRQGLSNAYVSATTSVYRLQTKVRGFVPCLPSSHK
jgi:hypothetical protein